MNIIMQYIVITEKASVLDPTVKCSNHCQADFFPAHTLQIAFEFTEVSANTDNQHERL